MAVFVATVATLTLLVLTAIVLRMAVWCSNACIGARHGPPIPQPGIFKATAVVLLVLVVYFGFSFVLALARDASMFGSGDPWDFRESIRRSEDPRLARFAWAFSIITAFLIWCWSFSTFLPTSIPRAALVTVFVHVLLTGFAAGTVTLFSLASLLPQWLTKGVTH